MGASYEVIETDVVAVVVAVQAPGGKWFLYRFPAKELTRNEPEPRRAVDAAGL